jgi:peptide/nickel transport system permease protein
MVLGTTEGRVGVSLAIGMLLLIIIGPLVAPHSPTDIGVGPGASGPTSETPLGTDPLGRDILSRFLSGGRLVIILPVVSVVLAFCVGGAIGMFGGYKGGRSDRLVARLIDVMLALPPLLVVLILIASLGTSRGVVVLSVALVFAPRIARILRGATQGVVTNDYVTTAQARGERTPVILVREILPNISAPAIADFALRITWAILFISTLSFLGLGEQPPSSDWGLMVAESREYLASNPIGAAAPVIGIAAISVASNLIADAVSRCISPYAREGGVQL